MFVATPIARPRDEYEFAETSAQYDGDKRENHGKGDEAETPLPAGSNVRYGLILSCPDILTLLEMPRAGTLEARLD